MNFIEYLKEQGIIENLKSFYGNSSKILDENDVLNNFFDDLKEILRSNEDSRRLLIELYEERVSHEKRKNLGAFYTPKPIVEEILDCLGYSSDNPIHDKKIIDISCGSGIFLIMAILRLKNHFLDKYHRKNIKDLTANEAKQIIETIEQNIHGIDINPLACILCQINIQFELFDLWNVINKTEHYDLPFFSISQNDALKCYTLETHDFVVGNPPYLFIRDIDMNQRKLIEESNLQTNVGQYDLYQLFIEIGIKSLKNQGYLGFIIPDSVLALSHRATIRNFIKQTCKIKNIFHVGPKFDDPVVSNIILILQREQDMQNRKENEIKVKFPISDGFSTQKIRQAELANWDFKFLINLNEQDKSIMNHLFKDFATLKDIMRDNSFTIMLNRGVELSKSGLVVYCRYCEKYFPIPRNKFYCKTCKNEFEEEHVEKIILKDIQNDSVSDFLPFLPGINRYHLKERSYINITKKGINYKNLEDYQDRIIIRQISQNNRICASHDHDCSLTSQSFYNLSIRKTPIPEFNNLYLLGLLNSLLLSYFFIKSFGTYKKLFPRILIEKIKSLPIKIPKTEKERKIAFIISENVQKILKEGKNTQELEQKIDALVFKLYEIQGDQKDHIMRLMEKLN